MRSIALLLALLSLQAFAEDGAKRALFSLGTAGVGLAAAEGSLEISDEHRSLQPMRSSTSERSAQLTVSYESNQQSTDSIDLFKVDASARKGNWSQDDWGHSSFHGERLNAMYGHGKILSNPASSNTFYVAGVGIAQLDYLDTDLFVRYSDWNARAAVGLEAGVFLDSENALAHLSARGIAGAHVENDDNSQAGFGADLKAQFLLQRKYLVTAEYGSMIDDHLMKADFTYVSKKQHAYAGASLERDEQTASFPDSTPGNNIIHQKTANQITVQGGIAW